MRNSLTSIFLLLAGMLLLSACENCENPTTAELTLEDASWIPQKINDKLIFENEKGERVRYNVTQRKAQTVYPAGTSLEDDCIEKFDTQAIMLLQDSTSALPQLASILYKSATGLDVRLAVQDKGDWLIDENTVIHPTKEINGITFNDVYEITPAETEVENGVKHIFFNKQHGFLYIEYNNGTFIKRKS